MELKFHFFPAAFPDETLHSVLSRYARLCGGHSRKAAFTGNRAAVSFTQNVAFPCRLDDLVGSLPPGTDLSVSKIITCHTVLPYYAPFLTEDQIQHARTSMAGDGKWLMLKLGVNASRLEGASRVRFCPACLNEDIVRVGAAYWHRVHQLPGVLVCPYHGDPLRMVDPSWYSRNSWQLNLPDDDDVQAHSSQIDAGLDDFPALHQIALCSMQLLTLDLKPLSPTAVRSCFVRKAAELGLTRGVSHRLDLCRLDAHMACVFNALPAAWEYSTLGESPADLPATWVTKLLRRPRHTHHPLKYIVLATALEMDLPHLLCGGKPSTPAVKRPSPIDVGYSKTRLSETLLEGLEGLSAAVWKLALAGSEARPIAAALGVSQVYVYRTIRAVNGGSKAWREARFLSERLRRRAAFEIEYERLQAHQCIDYMWLYRCDRAWLSGCIAKHVGIHARRSDNAGTFAVLDAKLAEQIRSCAQRLRAGSGKPVLISRARVGRELHILPRLEKQLSKLPLCARALEQTCESIEEFHARRLQWAKAKLENEQRSVTRSALYRTACIRP
ncbi:MULTISPECIES: TnsD family Tn7-like transposition protein [unclassified Pseudomonas]|uniref:TnsD family Tn7-like transposition protein n=1 Tax=unclassified Pseudomonas TaxID=196821 RepID=UPI0024484DC0|nr:MULTISPECIES: TnsD family Tn7-like transposition protein [unclassified Pseudomonas]MDG9929063.1 TnsD family transposase [Pseudomonas sp. GD04042]MDH0483776.1 TnsD family transposase [Pseudomonas sp. GD04015]MDH0604925.1 TnsD family transposase [Pseudomonas sp. GD03869]